MLAIEYQHLEYLSGISRALISGEAIEIIFNISKNGNVSLSIFLKNEAVPFDR